MQAVNVRAAAAEARCSVGFMRHYYDTKSLLLACTYELVTDTQLRGLEEVFFARREPSLSSTPWTPLGPERAAELLVTYLDLGEAWQFLVGVQLSFHALAQHDATVGEAVGSHHRRLRSDCMAVLREAGVPDAALKDEAEDLWVLLIGLTVLVPGLATDDGESRLTSLAPERLVGIVRRHLEAAVARTTAEDTRCWTKQVNDR